MPVVTFFIFFLVHGARSKPLDAIRTRCEDTSTCGSKRGVGMIQTRHRLTSPRNSSSGGRLFCEKVSACLESLPKRNWVVINFTQFELKVFKWKQTLRESAELQKRCVLGYDKMNANAMKAACESFISCLGPVDGSYRDYLKAISLKGTYWPIFHTGHSNCWGDPVPVGGMRCPCYETILDECAGNPSDQKLCLRAQMCRMSKICSPWKEKASCHKKSMREIVESLKSAASLSLIESNEENTQNRSNRIVTTHVIENSTESTERQLINRKFAGTPTIIEGGKLTITVPAPTGLTECQRDDYVAPSSLDGVGSSKNRV